MKNLNIVNEQLNLTRKEHEKIKAYVSQHDGILMLPYQIKRSIELGYKEINCIMWLNKGNFVVTPLSEIK
jgi:hypothetical protein